MFRLLSGKKRATQASSPTGKDEAPPTAASRETEPERVEERSVPAPFSPEGEDRNPSHEQIAIHAYHRWLERGKPNGTDREDWFEAERQLAATA